MCIYQARNQILIDRNTSMIKKNRLVNIEDKKFGALHAVEFIANAVTAQYMLFASEIFSR